MFQEGNYDVVEFNVPINGMNQFIAPDILPSNFCYLLENVIPSPMGIGTVRYGTDLTFSFENTEFNIVRSFPFIYNGSVNQAILYVSYYDEDLTFEPKSVDVIDQSHFSFDSTRQVDYIKYTKIKIVYSFNAVNGVLYSDIIDVSIAGPTVSIVLGNNLLPNPDIGTLIINELWIQYGSIYKLNLDTNTVSSVLKSKLSIACSPRASYSQQVMLICNGVDNVMKWDGQNLTDLSEYVIELGANNFTRLNATHFTFNSLATFVFSKYFVGNSIKLVSNNVSATYTIAGSTQVGNLVTITTVENLPGAFVAPVILYYQDKPPAFSYIHVAKDRIWALGPGAVSLSYRAPNEQLRVYYAYRPNSVAGYGLFNENTKTIPSIDMSDKHEIQDNFEAICQVNGLMAFIGRQRTQVWNGYTPGQGGDFSWQSNMPAGILHGDLLLELPNDVYFISKSGVHSFSTLNIAKQFSAIPEEAVDPIIKNFSLNATSSDSNYRKCLSFKYNDGIAGFKISDNKIIASLYSTRLYSWFYLSGDFRSSNCFMNFDKQFYMAIGRKIFKYADGIDGAPKKYGDQDGNSLINIVWSPGLISAKGSKRRYANKRYSLEMNYTSSFYLNNKNSLEISIFGDNPKTFSLTDKCEFKYTGDLLGKEVLSSHNPSVDTDVGLRLRKDYEVFNKRLKFVSSSFWISISGYVMNGPVQLRRIKLFGIGERNA